MLRFLFGLAIPVVGTVMGLTKAGGQVGNLLHISELMVIFGFIVGGVIMAFGPLDACNMFLCALNFSEDQTPERLRRNILICEGASKFSLYGGFTACFLGLVITLGTIAGDVSLVCEKIGAALTGLIVGAGIAGVLFQPLKFRFLSMLNELEESKAEKAYPSHENVLP